MEMGGGGSKSSCSASSLSENDYVGHGVLGGSTEHAIGEWPSDDPHGEHLPPEAQDRDDDDHDQITEREFRNSLDLGELEEAKDSVEPLNTTEPERSCAQSRQERSMSDAPVYGKFLPPDEMAERLGDQTSSRIQGLVWHAVLLPDDYKDKKHVVNGKLKTRRPLPQVRQSDFFRSLVKTEDGRWGFNGVLNGWPMLTNLELVSITTKTKFKLHRVWDAQRKKFAGVTPTYPKGAHSVRATLRSPGWSQKGWSESSPGSFFWFFSQDKEPKMDYGTQMIKHLQNRHVRGLIAKSQDGGLPKAVRAHVFAHRYAKKHESARDKLTYHTAVLLEWDHGQYTTVIEFAWHNGLGGYGGKSNWIDDRDSKKPLLYKCTPGELKGPWRSTRGEIRAIDHPAKDLEEFKAYVNKYTGPALRFLDPQFYQSSRVNVSMKRQDHLMQYLCNYILWNPGYTEKERNCQHFAADFFTFLTMQESKPYHKLCRVFYHPKTHHFMLDSPTSGYIGACPYHSKLSVVQD